MSPLPHFPCHRPLVLRVSGVSSLQVRDKLAAGAVPLGKFVITKQLTRRPEEYPDAKSQPHVQVALRRRAQNRRDGTLQARSPYLLFLQGCNLFMASESCGGGHTPVMAKTEVLWL